MKEAYKSKGRFPLAVEGEVAGIETVGTCSFLSPDEARVTSQ